MKTKLIGALLAAVAILTMMTTGVPARASDVQPTIYASAAGCGWQPCAKIDVIGFLWLHDSTVLLVIVGFCGMCGDADYKYVSIDQNGAFWYQFEVYDGGLYIIAAYGASGTTSTVIFV